MIVLGVLLKLDMKPLFCPKHLGGYMQMVGLYVYTYVIKGLPINVKCHMLILILNFSLQKLLPKHLEFYMDFFNDFVYMCIHVFNKRASSYH